MRKGIDVSKWQGVIDWDKVKKAGIDFAIIRVGYGQNNIDEQFVRNITECNRLGIPCGVYWFSYALNEEMARQEARYCLEAIKPYKVEYPVCFDFEYDSVRYAQEKGVIIDKALATALVEAFCDEVEKAGYYAMNYANKDYLKNMFDMDRLKKYDLWYAYWSSACDRDDAGIWQYTSDGEVDGITGRVDMNIAFKDYPAIIRSKGLNGLSKDEPSSRAEPDLIYIVKKGDTLSKIAAMFKTTVAKLVQLNKIKNPNLIFPGQKIKITGSENKEIVYTAQSGDTLWEIAKKYNTTVEKLARDNGIKNPNLIHPGQKLVIK